MRVLYSSANPPDGSMRLTQDLPEIAAKDPAQALGFLFRKLRTAHPVQDLIEAADAVAGPIEVDAKILRSDLNGSLSSALRHFCHFVIRYEFTLRKVHIRIPPVMYLLRRNSLSYLRAFRSWRFVVFSYLWNFSRTGKVGLFGNRMKGRYISKKCLISRTRKLHIPGNPGRKRN